MQHVTIRHLATYHTVNYAAFIAGMLIIWLASHSGWALLGGFIASLHVVSQVRSK